MRCSYPLQSTGTNGTTKVAMKLSERNVEIVHRSRKGILRNHERNYNSPATGGAKEVSRYAGQPQDSWKRRRSSDASKAIKKSCC
jgi:hypothetical protein